MKIKKLLFLSLFFIIGLFLFMPNSVNATVELNKIKIKIAEPLDKEKKIPNYAEVILSNDTEELVFDNIELTWVKYDSEGNKISLDITDNTFFEQNTKYGFNIVEESINDYCKAEGYSVAEDIKIYVNDVLMEDEQYSYFDFEVWIGGIKSISVEVEDLIVGKPLPKTVKYVFETETANEEIEIVLNCDWKADGVRVDENTLASLEVDYIPIVDPYSNQNNPNMEEFVELFNKRDFRTKMYINDELINFANGMLTFKAQKEVTFIEKITINFRNMEKFENITDDENNAFNFLAFKGMLNPSVDDNLYDKKGKLLFGIDENDNIIFADGLTVADNILYTLTEEDKIFYAEDSDIIPKQIEMIFVEDVKIYKVTFDANEGTFKEGKILTIEKWENGMEDTLEIPTRSGYKFLGFFTEKTGGTKLEFILAEAGISEDDIFYAQWQKVSAGGGQAGIPEGGEQEDNTGNTDSGNTNTGNTNTDNTNTNTNTNKPTINNPQTGDNIVLFIVVSLIAVVGIMVVIKVKKYVKE